MMFGRLVTLISTIVAIIFGVSISHAQEISSEPPSPTIIASPTWTPTSMWTSTTTWTPTVTWTATAIWTPTWTPIIQTVVVPITVAPIIQTIIVPPPTTISPITSVPPATIAPPPTYATPFYGWQRFESIHFIALIGSWGIFNHPEASAGQYRMSTSAQAWIQYPFNGDGVRIGYMQRPDGGNFEIVIDGLSYGIIDTYAAEDSFAVAGPWFLVPSSEPVAYHLLEIRSLAQTSGSQIVALDFVDVAVLPPQFTVNSTTAANETPNEDSQLIDVISVIPISLPPTLIPTPTTIPARLVQVTVLVSYDLNNTGTADLGEGVANIHIRLLDGLTNELLSTGVTDTEGQAIVQTLTTKPVVVYIPLLNQRLTINPSRDRNLNQQWNVLIPAGNQPGIIP